MPTALVQTTATHSLRPDEATEGRAVFQNLENDFPHRVIYQRAGDVLSAPIEGRMDGCDQAMDWRFDKAELNTRCPTP